MFSLLLKDLISDIYFTESYDFFLALTYRARIQLIFTKTRDIQYSPYINLCVSPYRVPNLNPGTKYKNTNEH